MTHQKLLHDLQGNHSQTDFAKEIGVSQSYLSRVLGGYGRRPSVRFVRALLNAYPERKADVLAAFFGGEHEDKQ